MSPIVIRTSQAANLSGGEPDTRTFQVLPRHRLRLAITEHTGRTSAIFETDAVARVRAGSGIGAARGRGTRNLGRSSPINSFGASKALRNLPRFKRDHQPCRIGLILAGPASSQHVTHVPISFRDPLASQEQENTERIPDDAKTGARPRNLTAREGNHAC